MIAPYDGQLGFPRPLAMPFTVVAAACDYIFFSFQIPLAED